MSFLASIGRVAVLFIEVFLLFLTLLLMIGAMMETMYATIGVVLAIGGVVYAFRKREQLDLIDRYFYYILAVFLTYGIAFIMTR